MQQTPGAIAIVTGGRDYKERPGDAEWFDACCVQFGITEVYSGAASGADALMERYARQRCLPVTRFPITKLEWDRLGKAAGPIRNGRMIAAAQASGLRAFVFALPGNSGTKNCCDQAFAAGFIISRRMH